MMEKLKYTKFKTLLISSFICISIIPVVLLGLFIFHLSKQELIRQSGNFKNFVGLSAVE